MWQLRYEKERRKEEVLKDEIIRRLIRLIHGASRRIHGTRQVRRILGIRSLNQSQQSSDSVWQRNLKRRTEAPMDLDFMTAPVVDEFGNAEYDNTIGEYIMNSVEDYDEEDTQFFDAPEDASHDAEGYEESGDPMY